MIKRALTSMSWFVCAFTLFHVAAFGLGRENSAQVSNGLFSNVLVIVIGFTGALILSKEARYEIRLAWHKRVARVYDALLHLVSRTKPQSKNRLVVFLAKGAIVNYHLAVTMCMNHAFRLGDEMPKINSQEDSDE